MRSKLVFLTKTSLKKKIGSKWFVIVNLILAVALIGIINIDQIISFFGGDFNDTIDIVVVDETKEVYPIFQGELENSKTLLNTEFKTAITISEQSVEEEQKKLEDSDAILVVFERDEVNYLKAKVISEGYIDTMDYQIITQSLLSTKSVYSLSKSNIDKVELNKISQPIEIERILLDDAKKSEDENMSMVMGTVFPTVILPFFMLTIFLVQMIGAEICEEKTTRSMEIIISNVSPKTHFFSKVLASNIFVIIQGLLLLLYGGIGLVLRNVMSPSISSGFTEEIGGLWNSLVSSGFADKLIYIIPLTLILMILSFLAYSLVAGILASMTVNMEDFQQIQTPIMFISLIGYYLAIMSSMFDGSIFIRVLSYVPFISSLLAPALLTLGQISVFDFIISIVIMILFDYVIIRYGMRIYKAGILNYSNEKVWNRLKRAIKTKEI